MLLGQLTGLRAHTDSDIEVFETELLTDVDTRIRATGRPWLPVVPGASDSPYRQAEDHDAAVRFSVVELVTGELAGEAVVSRIDLHNRHAEIGLVLRPAFRGRHLGTDVVRVLCHQDICINECLCVYIKRAGRDEGLRSRR